jgi:hypothetical protein
MHAKTLDPIEEVRVISLKPASGPVFSRYWYVVCKNRTHLDAISNESAPSHWRLGADMLACLHQEVRRADPELQRTERAPDGLTAYAHHVRLLVEPLPHRFDDGPMFPRVYPASSQRFIGRACLSDVHWFLMAQVEQAERGCNATLCHADGCETPVEPLLDVADVLVIFGNVDKILLAEVAARAWPAMSANGLRPSPTLVTSCATIR